MIPYFFSYAAPEGATLFLGTRPEPGGLPHVLLQVWLGNWGSVPTLALNGWNISLAGLVLPLLIAVVLMRGVRVTDVPRSALWVIAVSLLVNVLFVAYQAHAGFPDGGVHLVTLVMVLPVVDALRGMWGRGRPEYLGNPKMLRILPGLGLITMLPVDALGSVWMAQKSGYSALHGIQWVGGAGWHDGLLCMTGLVMATTAVVSWVYALEQSHRGKQASQPAAARG